MFVICMTFPIDSVFCAAARVGCKEAIKAMQDEGMRVIPYINGQLYDTLIPRWKAVRSNLPKMDGPIKFQFEVLYR